MNCELCQTYYYGGDHNYKCPKCGEMHEQRKSRFLLDHPTSKKTNCNICNKSIYYPGEGIRHHTSYLPVTIIIVCSSCHNKIHKGTLKEYCPSTRMAKIFYSKKGSLYFFPQSHTYWTGKYWVTGHSRPLTEWEKDLRSGMIESERIARKEEIQID